MKRFLIYIFIITFAVACVSCSLDEMNIPNSGKDVYIEYVAQPTSYSGYDVSTSPTKAAPDRDEPSTLEKRIVSAYFMVFGSDNERISIKTATIDDNNQIVPEKLVHNFEKGPLTICYLVNVRESYADSLDDLSKFSDPRYAYKMSYADPYVEGNLIGTPVLNGTQCFPMLGMITQSYENGLLSGVTTDEDGNFQSTIPLQRLFSKVYVQIKWNTQINGDALFGDQGFKMNFYKLSNLPKYVLMAETDDESDWVRTASCFSDPITIQSSQETSLLEVVEFTFYTPEYAVLPEAAKVAEVNGISGITDAQKQKYKPTLFDSAKNPICLTVDGTVSSTDFVDVPLEYTIYLGENAFDSFSVKRNIQYNNVITINGTGDAILGTDHRVEALYHNLADPNNTGTDNPANCYIIGRPGRYLIPTYRGNSAQMLGGIDISKKVIYSDGKNSITNVDFITENGKNWIVFDVNMSIIDGSISDLPAIEDGNTVMEFKDADNNTVWSWHLWFTSGGLLGSEWGAISSETYQGTEAEMMNRNLGAPGAGDNGMYYLWGDKDPYFTPSGKSAGYYGNVAAGSWSGNTKSVTDPCPPGYRVPTNAVWLGESAWKGTTAGADGAQFYSGEGFFYDMNPNVMFPFSSYLNGNTKVTHGDSSWSDKLENKDFGGTVYYRERYQLVDGLIWSSTQNQCLYYGVKKMQAEALGALYTIFGTPIEINPESRYWKYVSSIANKVVEWVIATDKSVYKNPGTSEVVTLNSSSGVQVRCVSETSPVK